MSSIQFALLNTTTIENLNRKTMVWTLAVYIPSSGPNADTSRYTPFRTITYPLGLLQDSAASQRTFAILHSKPGENPFDLGPWQNLQEVMGYSFWEWILPIKYSPCCDHESMESAFKLGPVVQQMKQRAGVARTESTSSGRRKRRRHRSKQHDYGKEHGYVPTRHDNRVKDDSSRTDSAKEDSPEVGKGEIEGDLEMTQVAQRPIDVVVR